MSCKKRDVPLLTSRTKAAMSALLLTSFKAYVCKETNIASRKMCILAHGPPPSENHQAAHSCGKGHEACVNPRHLYWATQVDNMKDQIVHGTRAYGMRHGRRKLTAEQVAEIRAYSGMARHEDIAQKFGVTRRTIGKIISGQRWSHS